jgi:predicted glycoside hydrolase/deacetylase ChbG (UPF0249 family)
VRRSANEDPVRVIVHADDLGMNQAANDATFAMMAAGKVTSATVMAGGDALEDAVERLVDFPNCSFGAHLALTEYGPLSQEPGLVFLLGADKRFANQRPALCEWGLLLKRDATEAIYRELSTQVQRLLDLGVPVSHIDSHHHVHTIGALFPVIKRVQRAFGLRRIRIAMNLFDGVLYTADAKRRAKTRLLNEGLRRVYPSVTTDGFTALRAFVHPAAHSDPLLTPGSTVELMVHPGHPLCEDENALLASDWPSRLSYPIELISYNELS